MPAYASDGSTPIQEFFVLVNVGHEGAIARYPLTAEDVTQLPTAMRNGKPIHVFGSKERRPFLQRKVSPILDNADNAKTQRSLT